VNNKGQFSIIAALFVAVILVSAVMVTYSTIRYGSSQDEPQTLSAIDETNLALKQVLGFTVGYYGSVLQVTGNSSYARMLATKYLDSGLENIADIRPEWGSSFTVNNLELGTNWFTNASYSEGNIVVTYALTGLGISGVTFSASCRLDVEISRSSYSSQVCLTVLKDENLPLNDLSKQNFKFYRYRYSNLTWEMVSPSSEPTSFSNGTYLINVPPEINPYSYIIQVADTRGITVAASSFSHYTSTLLFNSSFVPGGDYVDNYASTVDSSPEKGAHDNFTAQQYGPDGIYDTLTEANVDTLTQNYYPTSYSPLGSTTLASGSLTDLQSDNGVRMSFHSYPSTFSGSSTFGYATKGSSTNDFSYIRGSRFTTTSGGLANSISANLRFTLSSNTFGNTATGSSGNSIIDTIRGQQFTSPSSMVVVPSITAYIYCTTSAKNMKAAIYDSSSNLVAVTDERLIPAGSSPAWQTFTFASPPTLSASTNYVLVVWSQSGTSGNADLRYSSSSGGNGRYVGQTYGSWPSSVSFSTNNRQYSVYCNYTPEFKAKAAIYTGTGGSLVASTEEQTIATTIDGWVTFNFAAPPPLSASTQYVLVVWSSDASNVNIYYNAGTAEYFRQSATYPTWPSSVADQGSYRTYSIYCTYNVASEYTCEVEFAGLSNTDNWNSVTWTIDSSSSTSVPVTLQLYNYTAGQYSTGGDGYMTATLGSTDQTATQTINLAANPTAFRDTIGGWKLKFKAVNSASLPFDVNVDLARYSTGVALYALDLEEQWTDVNYTAPRPALCINASVTSSENLLVDVWYGGSWHNIVTGLVTGWNNVSVTSYVDSSTFTIRFRGANCGPTDTIQDNWAIDSVLLRSDSDQELFTSLQDAYCAVEFLQNGTMRWLGQNLQLTTQEIPLPPVPVKAIHVNQTTIDGREQEVPFQVEDWASGYTVPLGLTGNATVFGNRQMIVFLVNTQVSKFTIWWNGSDTATQTPLAYNNLYFQNDKTNVTQTTGFLSNGLLNLTIERVNDPIDDAEVFKVTSVAGTSSSVAKFMRINGENSTYGANPAYVIHHGIVRDIVQQEAEWSNGVTNGPNLYANIVLTLPANATYFTYQLGLMFINSQQTRNINDLCPIKLSCTISDLQTENGIVLGDPIVANGTQTFNSTGIWGHHWSQFTDGTKGAGIMFTNSSNQLLYTFDAMAPTALRGALKADATAQTIQLLPVTLNPVSFQSALNVVWAGAVATFDGTTPIYGGLGQSGLWILAEIPPTITVSTDN
jgi:hypothetical protein